jgi:hypothetical protein
VLTDRDSLKRALYRLVNTDDEDDALLEHDATPLDGVHEALEVGLDDAQLYLIDSGLGDYWLASSGAISWQGSDPERFWPLPDGEGADPRFLRMYGDRDSSALRDGRGRRWGREIPATMRWRYRGNAYYTTGPRLYLARGASPPHDLVLDYLYRPPVLEDGVEVDFPREHRPLIVAYAARYAMEQSWLAGGPEMEQKILRNLRSRKAEAWRRARRSRTPKMAEPSPMVGDHWFFT